MIASVTTLPEPNPDPGPPDQVHRHPVLGSIFDEYASFIWSKLNQAGRHPHPECASGFAALVAPAACQMSDGGYERAIRHGL